MDREQAKAEAKERLPEYLRMKGINPLRQFHCLNPLHTDKNPSMGLVSTGRAKGTGVNVHCRGCKATYDVFELIRMDYRLTDDKAVFDKAYEIFGIQIDSTPRRSKPEEDFREMDGQKQDKTGRNEPTPTGVYTHAAPEEKDYTGYYAECKGRITETDYHRGLSLETLERHYIGYEPHFKTRSASGEFVEWRALIIPTGKGSYAARNTDANAGHGDRYRKRGAAHIFSHKTLTSAASPIFVVEGEIDCMSIEEAGGAAVGLGSYDNVPLLLRLLETEKPSQPLIIAFDNETEPDKAKRVEEAEKQLSDGLERLKIPYYRLRPYGSYHDANEALNGDRDALREAIAAAANIEKQAEDEERSAYLSTSTAAHLQAFVDGIAASVDTPCIPTGFSKLDTALDGGLYEGLYTIGAISSLGKTTLVMNVADKVAASGTDVLVFSLEMARAQLMSKSISRLTFEIAQRDGIDKHNAKTARGITDGKRHINYSRTEQKLIQDAITAYSAFAERIYIQEGIGDIGVTQIRETVERHIRFTGRRPVVICDYLQIVAPYNERMTDKQNTDKAVLELKRISRDCKIPIIAISSFNRDNYKAAVNMAAFKESGAVEYSSDVLIGLQLKGAGGKDFDELKAKRGIEEGGYRIREIELVILKNREAAVGDKIEFRYYPMFNYFSEA